MTPRAKLAALTRWQQAMEKADAKIKDAASATGEKMEEAGEALKQKAGQ